MTLSSILPIALLLAAATVFTVLLIVPSRVSIAPPQNRKETARDSGTESVVTVRKVRRDTPSAIRRSVNDHWEGTDDYLDIPPPPTEVTLREEPTLYAEYLSPETSAIRRYEIADELYGQGYTLPYIKGLSDQYNDEMKEAIEHGGPDARTIHERTPVNLTPKQSVNKIDTPETE